MTTFFKFFSCSLLMHQVRLCLWYERVCPKSNPNYPFQWMPQKSTMIVPNLSQNIISSECPRDQQQYVYGTSRGDKVLQCAWEWYTWSPARKWPSSDQRKCIWWKRQILIYQGCFGHQLLSSSTRAWFHRKWHLFLRSMWHKWPVPGWVYNNPSHNGSRGNIRPDGISYLLFILHSNHHSFFILIPNCRNHLGTYTQPQNS